MTYPAPPTSINPVSCATSSVSETTYQPVVTSEYNEAYIQNMHELLKDIPEPEISYPEQSQSLLDYKMTYSPPPTYANLRDTILRNSNPFNRLSDETQQFYLREDEKGFYIALISLYNSMGPVERMSD